MENHRQYFCDGREAAFLPAEGVDKGAVACLPIISAGDVTGAVAFLENGNGTQLSESQRSLIQAASQFLGKQIEL